MKLDYSPFYFVEYKGKTFHSEEDFERFQKKEREDFYNKKTCFQRIVMCSQICVYSIYFFFLLMWAKIVGN